MSKLMTAAITLALLAGPVMAQEGSQANAPHPAEGAQPGLLELNVASIVWVIIFFLIVVAILYKAAWKNVLAGLKAREERIRGDIRNAEEARLKAEATLRDYTTQLQTAEQQVRDIIARASADAEKLAASIKMSAQQESEAIKTRATKDIEAAKNQALAEVYEQTANLATAVAEKIIRRNLNADDQRELVNRSLQEIQGVGR